MGGGARHYRWQRFDGVTYMDRCSYKGTKGGTSGAVMGCNGLNGRGAQSRKVTKKNTKMLELAATLDYFPGIKEPAMRKEKSR